MEKPSVQSHLQEVKTFTMPVAWASDAVPTNTEMEAKLLSVLGDHNKLLRWAIVKTQERANNERLLFVEGAFLTAPISEG